MKTYLDCFPCFLSQALRAARIATDDEMKIKRVLDKVGMMLKDIPLDSTPPETGRLIYRIVREITGNNDPYKEIKEESTKIALGLYPSLKAKVEEADNDLLLAIKIAITGNVIDFGANWNFDISEEVEKVLEKDFAICDYDEFERCLNDTEEVLYLGDNAGECVFDRVLIEKIGKKVKYVVRGMPVINDATYEDAIKAGIGEIADIISSGTDAPGTILETCRGEFRDLFYDSKFIISKGQGNYEALSDVDVPIFFLFKAKCEVIARNIGVKKGDIVLKYSVRKDDLAKKRIFS
ncbi:MAG TPA: DUF89 family protein [Deltaproteobacteria bacterium]|nr:DUF89 family protein [Deltaproteobacteria bacterium]